MFSKKSDCARSKFLFILFLMLGQVLVIISAPSTSIPTVNGLNQFAQVSESSTESYILSKNTPYSKPYYITISSTGDLYITERTANRVQKNNSTGTYPVCDFSSTDPRLHVNQPDGIDIDASDNVYIADSGNNRILVINSEGKFVKELIGTKESGIFNHPMGVAVDNKGNIYVADSYNSVVKIFDKDGNFLKNLSIGLASPESISVDQSGKIYVGDEDTNSVHIFESGEAQHSILAPSGSSMGMVNDPEDLTVDNAGNVYVSDSGNNRIQKFNPQGTVVAVIDGTVLSTSSFNHQRGVVVDKDGNLYVADTENDRILMFLIPTSGNIRIAVKDQTGIPIAGAKVSMISNPDEQVTTTGYTNSYGVSLDSNLMPGDYRYEISKSGYLSVITETTKVIVGVTSDITITLVAGTPTTGNLKVMVFESNGLPILGAHVESSIWPDRQTILSSTSDSSHTFFFSDLFPGEYQMKASKNSYITGRSDTVRINAGETVEITITLQIQQSTGDLEIIVKNPRGEPISEATIMMNSVPDMQSKLSGITNIEGKIIFPNVLPGNYVFKVQKNGFDDAVSDPWTVLTGRSTDVIITMHHRVLDKFEFALIANTQYKDTEFDVKITAIDPYGEKFEGYTGTNTLTGNSASVSPTSTTAFENGVWEGKVKVSEVVDSMKLITASPDGKTGESNQFKVQGQNTGDLEIIVKNEFGNTIGGARVYCYPPQVTGLPALWQDTSPDGIVIFRGLTVYGYTIYAEKAGYDASPRTVVTVIQGVTTKTVITLTNPNPETGGFPCFIATATYGSPASSEVVYTRHVRDDLIGSNEVGKVLVNSWNKFYYSWSPPIAYSISGSPQLRFVFTILLVPLLGTIHVVDFVFNSVAWFNPELASVIGFFMAAVISIGVYIVLPVVILKRILNRSKKKSI